MRIINQVKRQRVLHDWTQEELALKVGVTRQTIIALEKGNYTPSLMLAIRLAAHFSTSIESIFQLEEEDNDDY